MIKHTTALISLLCIALLVSTPAAAQPPRGLEVTCSGGGPSFTNGVEFVVPFVRPGDEATVTAVGLNNFDPILAVSTTAETGEDTFVCNDDDEDAAQRGADLPTTGPVDPSNFSAQLLLSNDSTNPDDTFEARMIVGSFGDVDGEFLLIIEGLTLTETDTEEAGGDPFAVRVTPGMAGSDVPLTMYMIAQFDQELDPYMALVESDTQGGVQQLLDESNAPIQCDDAGNTETCWGDSVDLSDSFVLVNREDETVELKGFEYDSMLSIPAELNQANADESFINVLMTSWGQESLGEYVAVFHASTGPTS